VTYRNDETRGHTDVKPHVAYLTLLRSKYVPGHSLPNTTLHALFSEIIKHNWEINFQCNQSYLQRQRRQFVHVHAIEAYKGSAGTAS